MKALLITLAAILIGVLLLAGAGYMVWQKYGEDLMVDIRAGIQEGKDYAQVASDKDCYYRTLSRMNECNEFGCIFRTKAFAEHCLRNTATVTDLCDNVPGITSFLDYGRWVTEVCAREAPNNQGCDKVLQEVSKYCVTVNSVRAIQKQDKQNRQIE